MVALNNVHHHELPEGMAENKFFQLHQGLLGNKEPPLDCKNVALALWDNHHGPGHFWKLLEDAGGLDEDTRDSIWFCMTEAFNEDYEKCLAQLAKWAKEVRTIAEEENGKD